jgi:hypothetical protein
MTNMKRPTFNTRQDGGMFSGIAGLIVTPYTFIAEEKEPKKLPKQKVMKSSKKKYPTK